MKILHTVAATLALLQGTFAMDVDIDALMGKKKKKSKRDVINGLVADLEKEFKESEVGWVDAGEVGPMAKLPAGLWKKKLQDPEILRLPSGIPYKLSKKGDGQHTCVSGCTAVFDGFAKSSTTTLFDTSSKGNHRGLTGDNGISVGINDEYELDKSMFKPCLWEAATTFVVGDVFDLWCPPHQTRGFGKDLLFNSVKPTDLIRYRLEYKSLSGNVKKVETGPVKEKIKLEEL